jgi:hypothetical protein
MITASIDVTLLDKSFFRRVVRSSGEVAIFCDLALFETPNSKVGGWMIKQDIGADARLSGLPRPIVGNAVNPSKMTSENVNK